MATRKYKSENAIQQECYIWFHNTYPNLRGLLFAVPNGGARSAVEGRLLKETGVVAGVSDMLLLYNKKVFCFELKTIVGKQSDKQVEWQSKVESQDIPYFIVRDKNAFKIIVESIIESEDEEK